MTRIKLILLCAAFAVLAANAQAATVSWNNVGSGDFSLGGNWTGGNFPATADNAEINNGGTALLGVTIVPNAITGLGIGSDLTNTNNTGLSGTLTQSGQTLTVTGEVQIGNNGGTGTYNISGGTLNAQSWFSIGRYYDYTNGVPGAIGLLSMTGGVINHNGADFDIGERGTGTQGTLTMSGSAVFNNTGGSTMIGAGDFGGAMGNGVGEMDISGNAFYNHTSTAGFNVGFNGSAGTLNMNGGTVSISGGNSLYIGNGGGATGTVNLNAGALLQVTSITMSPNSGTGTFNFNGGTLQALASSASFLQQPTTGAGTAHAYVKEGGAIFDTQTYNITVNQALEHGGSASIDGGLYKTGSGTLRLAAGNNDYTGPTTVHQGTLLVHYQIDPVATVTVQSGATLGGNAYQMGPIVVQAGGIVAPGDSAYQSGIGTLSAASLSLSNAYLNYEFYSATGSVFGWDKVDVSSGTLTATGTNTFKLSTATPGSLSAGSYTLITFNSMTGDLSNFKLDSSVLGSYTTSLQLDDPVTPHNIDLVLTLASIKWVGSSGGLWSVSTNWLTSSGANTVPNGADTIVQFGTDSSGTVILNINPTVGTVTFDNYSASYTLSSTSTTSRVLNLAVSSGNAAINVANGTHFIAVPETLQNNLTVTVDNASDTLTISKAISNNSLSSGTYSLTKQGSGTLALTSTNAYTGATIINGGTIVANTLAMGGSNSSIGASLGDSANLVFNNATLSYTGSNVSTDRGFTMNGNATIGVENGTSTPSTLTFSGSVQVLGDVAHFIKTGSGTLTYTNSSTTSANTLAVGSADVAYDVQNGGVVINGGAGVYNITNGSLHVGSTTSTPTFTLTSGTLNIGTNFILATINGTGETASAAISGTMNVPGNFVLANGAGTTAIATIGPGAQVSITGDGTLDGVIGNNGGNATLTMTGGTLTIHGWFAVGRHWDLSQTAGTTGVFTFSGGTVNNVAGGWWQTMDIGQRGTGVQGTLNMSGSAVLNVSTADFRIGAGDAGDASGGGGNGYMTIADTAQLNMLGANTFNVGDTGTNGSLTMNGGTITLSNGLFNVGTGVAGSTSSHGSLTIHAGTLNVNNWIAIGQGGGTGVHGTGTVTMTGGTVNKTGGGGIVLGSTGGTGTWTQSGGTINNNTALILGEYGTATSLPGSGTFYLNGGLVQATQVQAGTTTNPGTATGTFYFNGGTLQATAASADFMTTAGAGATLAVKVQHNGAIIDTNNFNVTINQILAEDSSSTGGGLTKVGSGTLSLSAVNTYTGATTVNTGTLELASTGQISTSSAISNSATFEVNGGTHTVSTISGTGTTKVLGDGSLTATSIVQDTLDIGSGSWATSDTAAIDGGSTSGSLSEVPEPATWAMLMLAAMGLGIYWRRRR